MFPAMFTSTFLLFAFFCTLSAAKPVQESSDQAPVRRLDSLAGLTMGSSKSTRSVSPFYHSRIPMDTLSEDEINFLHFINSVAGGKTRSLGSSGSANTIRNLDSLGGGNYLRALDSLGGGNMLRHPSPMIQQSGYDYRSLDSLGGGNLLRREQHYGGQGRMGNARSDKRLDTLSGITLGHQKRNLDEVDRTAFDDLRKRDFDEVDRAGFDGFSKRNVRSANDFQLLA